MRSRTRRHRSPLSALAAAETPSPPLVLRCCLHLPPQATKSVLRSSSAATTAGLAGRRRRTARSRTACARWGAAGVRFPRRCPAAPTRRFVTAGTGCSEVATETRRALRGRVRPRRCSRRRRPQRRCHRRSRARSTWSSPHHPPRAPAPLRATAPAHLRSRWRARRSRRHSTPRARRLKRRTSWRRRSRRTAHRCLRHRPSSTPASRRSRRAAAGCPALASSPAFSTHAPPPRARPPPRSPLPRPPRPRRRRRRRLRWRRLRSPPPKAPAASRIGNSPWRSWRLPRSGSLARRRPIRPPTPSASNRKGSRRLVLSAGYRERSAGVP